MTQEAGSATRSWPDYLNTIGTFVGTHGLAVFLVVYYATVLYPQVNAERREWIEQITRLRQLIDPETRPVNSQQAETILRIVASDYVERLRLWIDLITGEGGGSGLTWGTNHMTVWDQIFDWKDADATAPEGREQELRDMLARFNTALKQRQEENRQAMILAFERSREGNELDAYQLGRLRYGASNLEAVWRTSEASVHEAWLKELGDFFSPRDTVPVDEFRKFVQKHPAYQRLVDKKAPEVASLTSGERKSVEQALASLKNQLEGEITKKLTETASERVGVL